MRISIPLCSEFELRTPQPEEFDELVTLRNRYSRWFADAQHVSAEAGREWLNRRSPDDALLVVVGSVQRKILGTIGWRDLDKRGETEGGRIIVDHARALSCYPPSALRGLTLRAVVETSRFLFEQRGIARIWARTFRDNAATLALLNSAGFKRINIESVPKPDWRDRRMIVLSAIAPRRPL